MKVGVVGVGAVGGFFGGRLARAGEEVTFLARGRTLEAMEGGGLRVDSVEGDFALDPVRVSGDPGALCGAECVLVCVKAWQVEEVGRQLAPVLGADAFVVPLENGVEAPDALAAALGRRRVLGGLCRILCRVVEPGHVEHFGVEPSVACGELDGGPSPRAERLAEALRAAGVRCDVPESIAAALWEKLLFIAPTSGIGAAIGLPLGVVREQPESRALLEAACREIWTLARARGVPVREDAVERTLRFVDALPADSTASMQRDLMAGRPSELEAQVGGVVRLGEEAGVAVPVHRFLYAVLAPRERRHRAAPADRHPPAG